MACPGIFGKDPEKYLKAMKLEFPCPVHPERKAALDPKMRVSINYELFYFSDRSARREFLARPLRYCGTLTDPVTRTRFRPTVASPRRTFHGRDYYFSADSTLARFKAMPDSFAVRKGA